MILRRLLAALAAVALATACAGNDDALVPTETSVSPDADGTPETRPPGTATQDDPATNATSPTSAGGGEPTTTSGAPTTTSETGLAGSPAPSPGGVGSFATFYLQPSRSASIVLDVHSQSGAEPRAGTLQHLDAVLGQVSGKPVSTSQGSLGGSGQRWTADAIRDLADSVAPAQTRDAAVLTLLYLHGELADRENVIGVAVRSDVAAVFSDKVAEAAGVLGNPAAVEDAVSLHEIGHILGLVDLVLDTGRQDPEHPGHSPNRASVMYYAVETTLIGTILEGGPPRDFDQADLDDLARIRNA